MTSELITIPARRGKAVRLEAGQSLKIVNTHGTQVLDTWALCPDASDGLEYLSMEHSRSYISRIVPRAGDALVSNRYRPILVFAEDRSPGVHDTLMCSCSQFIYRKMGCDAYHDNCEDNFHAALQEVGIAYPFTPGPLNLFMNFPVAADGTIGRVAPESKPGDFVVLKALDRLLIVLSACPQDLSPINGAAMQPTEAHCRIL